MTLTDQFGLEMSATDAADIARHDRLVDGYLMFEADMVDRMAEAVPTDVHPDSVPPLTRILHAQLLAMSHTPTGTAAAASAAASLAHAPLFPRERLHLEALAAVAEGEVDDAIDAWGRVIDDHPADFVALRLQHFALFNQGRLGEMVSRAVSAQQHWADHPELPYQGLADGMVCFSLEENGRYREAEPHGRDAVDRNPDDLWSIHAVAHVLEMQGRTDDGITWIESSRSALTSHGSFAGHVWWHLALHHLETGDHGAALDLFDEHVSPEGAVEGLTLTNSIALLARIEWAGGEVGDRWARLINGSSMRIGHHSHPFNDCHYSFALTRADRTDLAEQLLAGMAQWSAERSDSAAAVIDNAAMSVATAMHELALDRPDAAATKLRSTAGDRWCLGGSHAQRDLFNQAELRATIDAGDPAHADRLIARRLAAKPDSARNHMWLSETSAGAATGARDRAKALGWQG